MNISVPFLLQAPLNQDKQSTTGCWADRR